MAKDRKNREAKSPFEGPGFWNWVNRQSFKIAGPAQVGIGYGKTEAPYTPPADPTCPICHQPMSLHNLNRGNANTPTYISCPNPPVA
jgi:hypothetical protein